MYNTGTFDRYKEALTALKSASMGPAYTKIRTDEYCSKYKISHTVPGILVKLGYMHRHEEKKGFIRWANKPLTDSSVYEIINGVNARMKPNAVKRTQLSKSEIKEISEAVRFGYTISEIQELTGVNRNKVYSVYKTIKQERKELDIDAIFDDRKGKIATTPSGNDEIMSSRAGLFVRAWRYLFHNPYKK